MKKMILVLLAFGFMLFGCTGGTTTTPPVNNVPVPPVVTVVDCSYDLVCFNQNVAYCSKAKVLDTSDPTGTLSVSVEGTTGTECVLKFVYTTSSIPEITGKDWTCTVPMSLTDYKVYIGSLSNTELFTRCKGPFMDYMAQQLSQSY
ncbi:MAG: hypothetical protein ABII22_06295 [Candidatus Micrarchaeota archaeon]